MNNKKRKLFVGLSILFVLALVAGTFTQPVLAGGGTEDICQKDGTMENAVISGDVVRDTFKDYKARLRGPGSTVVMVGKPADGVHAHVIIWVVLYHNKPTKEYTVRVINVVTGCNG
jgi:hypothetical protein